MKATEAQIAERLPVWEALSEFFLDTDLQPDDYVCIARKLAATTYTENEIEEILVCEVCPVCRWNMLWIAGEWAGFDRAWLKKRIGPRYGKKVKFRRLFELRHRGIYAPHWNKVKTRMSEIRTK